MPLTQEQIQQFRDQYKLGTPGQASKANLPSAPTVTPRTGSSPTQPDWYTQLRTNPTGKPPLPPAKTLPQKADDIANKPAFDLSTETNPLKAIGKSIVNTAKSVAVKLPYNVVKTVATGIKDVPKVTGVISGAAKDFNDAAQSQLGLNDQIKKLKDAIVKNQREGKDTSRLENALKLAGGTKSAPQPLDYIVPAAISTVIPPAIKKGYEAGRATAPVEGAGQGIIEGVRTAAQDLAEDPGQALPYLLGGKGAIEESLPKVDTAISTVGGVPKKVTGVVVDSVAKPALEAVKTGAQNKYAGQLYDTYQEVFTGTKAAKKSYDAAIKTGKDPAQFGANNGYVVDVSKGKIDATPTIARVSEEYIAPRAKLLDDMLAAKDKTIPKDQYVSLDELATKAKAEILKDPLAKGRGNLSARQKAIDTLVEEFKKQFGGDRVSLVDLNNIKKGQWAESSSFSITKPDVTGFMGDVHYQLGSAAKQAIEDAVPEATIKQLNAEIGDAANFNRNLNKVNGNAVKGGRLGKYFARTTGAIVGSHAGPFGTVSGALIGNYISELMQANYIAGPIKRQILQNIKPDSALYEQAQATLKQLENTPPAVESLPTPTQVIQPAELGQEPFSPLIRVNNFQNPYPKYLPPDLLNAEKLKVESKANAGKPLDITPPRTPIRYEEITPPKKVKLPVKKKAKNNA